MIWFRLALLLAGLLLPGVAFCQEAEPVADPIGEGAASLIDEASGMPVPATVRLVILLTTLTFLPAILLVMTPFTRFVIVFSLLRQALGLQQAPPNQVLIGLALFMSLLVMQPTVDVVQANALEPFMAGEMETMDAINAGLEPMREFMLGNTRRTDLAAVMEMGRIPQPETLEDLPTSAVVSAFVLSELKTALVI